MPTHPNRSKRNAKSAANPDPDSIRALRVATLRPDLRPLTQANAAAMIHCTPRAWEDWEAGRRKMHPAFWQYFQTQARRLRRAIDSGGFEVAERILAGAGPFETGPSL